MTLGSEAAADHPGGTEVTGMPENEHSKAEAASPQADLAGLADQINSDQRLQVITDTVRQSLFGERCRK